MTNFSYQTDSCPFGSPAYRHLLLQRDTDGWELVGVTTDMIKPTIEAQWLLLFWKKETLTIRKVAEGEP